MATLDRYLEAASREATRVSYASARRHFEEHWGGVLPATPDMVAHYLADHAAELANSTLRQRVAALSRWHAVHGFVDPTQSDLVKQTLKGIRAIHGARTRQAVPLQIAQLQALDAWLQSTSLSAQRANDLATWRQTVRDRALLLVGFWQGFRGDELVRLQVRDIAFDGAAGMSLFLSRSKGDRQNEGHTYALPALSRMCPVQALSDWLACAELRDGAVFRRVTRWGSVGAKPMHAASLVGVLRRMVAGAGLTEVAAISAHSLRRGFAGWANANGWDLKALMQHVGWKDLASAMRYVDVQQSTGARIEAGLAQLPAPASVPPALPAPTAATAPARLTLELSLNLSTYGTSQRGLMPTRRSIEQITLARHRARRLDKKGTRFQISFDIDSPDGPLDERISEFLDELHRTASNNDCHLEASLKDPKTLQCWD